MVVCMSVSSVEEITFIKDEEDPLANEITLLAGQLNAGEYRLLKLIAEFDLNLGWAGAGIKSCAHWLNWKCGISMVAARERIRSARALADLPEIDAAFERGELSYSKVRAMTRVATPENESYLMMIAKYGTAQHMERLVKQYKRVKHLIDIEGPELEDRDQRELRDVFCFQEDDGMWNITARLPAEEGGLLVKALNAIVDQLKASQDNPSKNKSEEVPAGTFFNDATDDGLDVEPEIPTNNRATTDTSPETNPDIDTAMQPAEEKDVPAETFSADSYSDKPCSEETNAEDPEVKAESLIKEEPLIKEEQPTMGQRRADALSAMAEHILAGGSADKEAGKGTGSGVINLKSLKGSERCQLILHVKSGFSSALRSAFESKDSSIGGVDQHAGTNLGAGACGCGCDSEDKQTDTLTHLDGQWLPPHSVKRLACDASFLLVEEDDAGNVLDIGRRSRVISPAMARALSIRDGGCQFPGCCETHYVEGHHIIHWANGGETKMENLVTLCRYHHQELHKGAFFLTLSPPKLFTKEPSIAQAFADRLVFTSGADGYVIPRNPVNFTSSDYDFSVLQDSLPEEINADTAVCHWTGERMDYGMGIDGLLWADGMRP